MIAFGSSNRLPPGAAAFDLEADGSVEVHGYTPSGPDLHRAPDLLDQVKQRVKLPPDPAHLRRRILEFWPELGSKLGSLVACGSFACTYGTDDPRWIVKITADWTEAAAWAAVHATGVTFRGLARTPLIGALTLGPDLAATYIVQERLIALTNDEQHFVSRINSDLVILAGLAPWFPADRSRIVVNSLAKRDLVGGPKRVKPLLDALAKLDRLGIRTADLHGAGNLLKRVDGTIVLADFGVADAPSSWIPALQA